MSVPASEMGSVGSSSPTSVSTPSMLQTAAATALTSNTPIVSGLASFLTGASSAVSSKLPNYALVAVGAILILGALLISQKETVVQVASKTSEVAA